MEENIWETAFPKQEEKIEEVKDEISEDLSVLLNLGRLTSSFSFWGHNFTIQTLKMNEELKASSIAGQYSDNLDKGARAFITALVACSISEVDGNPLVGQLGPNDDTVLDRKFNYVVNNYYWQVVEHLYDQYVELSKRVDLALEEFKKK